MATSWQDYQEEAASFFRSLGMDAQTNVRLNGVRTCHDVDVLVKSRHVGFEITWIVECKHWRTPVNKLHVLALREIVAETGADRGILLSESGFQVGAKEAASLTNVHLRSLAESVDEAGSEVTALRLTELNERVQRCRSFYWELPKSLRIEHGLRPESTAGGYSGNAVIRLTEDTLLKAFRKVYPFDVDFMWRAGAPLAFPETFHSTEQVVAHLEPLIFELETKLENCIIVLPIDHPVRVAAMGAEPRDQDGFTDSCSLVTVNTCRISKDSSNASTFVTHDRPTELVNKSCPTKQKPPDTEASSGFPLPSPSALTNARSR